MKNPSRQPQPASGDADKLRAGEQELSTLRFQASTAAKRTERFDFLVRAVGEVQQLLFQESDQTLIIQNLCALLVEHRVYAQAWIVLFDANGLPEKTAQSGFHEPLEKITLPKEDGSWVRCLQAGRERSAVLAIMDPAFSCGPCPLAAACQRQGQLMANVGYGHRTFGVLAVAIPRTALAHEEEKSTLRLLANVLGAAFFRQEFEPDSEKGQSLAREYAMLQAALNVLPTPVSICNERGQSLWANRAETRRLAPPPAAGSEEAPRTWLIKKRPYPGPDNSTGGTIEIAWDNTDQALLENSLREALETQQKLVTAAREVLWASDPGGTFTSVSPQIEAALGYAPQDLLGHSLTELTNPENRGEFQLEFNRCLEAQTPSRIAPCFLQHKNGKTLAWEISLEPCFNPAGLCLGFKGSAQDMTAQLLAEKSQEEKEACFQSLQKILLETDERQKNMLASGHDILWVTDAQGKFTAISPQIEPLFGYPPDELIGLTPVNFFEMQNYEKFKDADLESMLLKPAVMETMLVTMHHRDGQELIIEINAEPVWGVPETFLGYRGCCRDVTEQKRAEFALEESEARFHNIFSSSPSALCLADPQGQVAEVNRSMCELFGALAEADIKGLSLFEYLPLSDENQHDLRAHRIIRFEGAYDPTMLRNRRAFTPQQTGSLHLEVLVSLVPWQNTDSEGYLVQIQDVTDRKIAEDALCQSEEKYRTIFENCGTALIIINEDLSLTLINREMENLTGYTSRELLDLNPWLKIVATADLEKIQAFHVQRRIDPDSVPRSYEICFCHKNGEKRIALLSATLIPSTRQSLAALVDITERKQIEEALRLSEEKYRATFENSGNALALIEDDLSISLANPELEVLLGVSRSELEGRKKWPDFLANGEELNKFNRYREQLLRDPGDLPKSCECILRHQNGSLRDVMAAMTYLPASHQFLITFIDITERKAAEKKLLESEKRYRLLADNIHDVIWMADADRRLTFVTPSITRLRGFSVEEVLGQKIEQAFTPESVQRMKDWDTSEKPKSAKQTWGQSLELEQICRDGSTVWTEVHISPMLDSAGRLQGYVGMSRDISARRQAEFEQRRLEEQLRQSQKMEIIGHLAGGIAHDFNNLLTPILGYADMAASQVPAGNPLANDIKAIQETAERAARLTRQLLAFSLKQVLHMSTVQLNREIMDFIKMLHSLIGEHILVRTELAPDLGCIKADITQVQQVLMNLAVNARDAMPRGGSLTFSTANVLVDEALIKRHPALNAGAHVRLTVTDTGTGIAPEILAHIFEPFFTTKERGKGTGLGLSMVYGIVTQHQGAVVAESEPGKGSALHVYFPWVEATPALAEDHAAVEENGGGHETILVVEDEPMVRKLALEFLSGQGYTVLEASDPLQALEFLRSYAGNFDLLLTDIIMPGMNGKELFEHLAQERPKLKVLYMSGYSEDVIAHQGVLDAGTELLSKPFALKALLTKVRSVLDQPAAT